MKMERNPTDRGINPETVPFAAKAGGTRLVAGHAVFSGDLTRNIEELGESVKSALERPGAQHDK